MKSFDLEKALAGDPVITRSGRKVIEIIKLEKRKTNPVIAVLEDDLSENDLDRVSVTCIKGKSCGGEEYDLFMTPKIKKYYMNIYPNNVYLEGRLKGANIYESKDDCIKDAGLNRITTIEFELPI